MKPGRKPHIPTDEDRHAARLMASIGVKAADIATALKISPRTLWTHYGEEITNAAVAANTRVAERLYSIAMGHVEGAQVRDSLTASIFWLKTRARWRETDRLEVTGAEGSPLQVDHAVKMTDEQLLEIIKKGGVKALPPPEDPPIDVDAIPTE